MCYKRFLKKTHSDANEKQNQIILEWLVESKYNVAVFVVLRLYRVSAVYVMETVTDINIKISIFFLNYMHWKPSIDVDWTIQALTDFNVRCKIDDALKKQVQITTVFVFFFFWSSAGFFPRELHESIAIVESSCILQLAIKDHYE